jgi:hypothetical protein
MQACSGDDFDCDLSSYSFFDPNIINQPNETPFFVTCHGLYEQNENAVIETLEATNIKEWTAYLKDSLSYQNLNSLFYMSEQNCDSVFGYYNKTIKLLPQEESINELAQKFSKLKKSIAEYFIFSRKMDRLTSTYDSFYWEYRDAKVDTASFDSLIIIGKQNVKKTNDKFLKARYIFQVQRILFYLHRYDACINWYDENIQSLSNQGSLSYRAESSNAGCYYHKKNYAQSNYLFSLIYDQYPSLKATAFLSFHPWEDADWSSSLTLAKTTHEKEVLWQLFGIYADPLKGMQEIYTLNPKSPLIDLLLVRAIAIYEKEQLKNTRYESYYGYRNDAEATTEIASTDTATLPRYIFDSSNSFLAFKKEKARVSLTAFIEQTTAANLTNNPCLWLNAAAYINWINQNYKATETYLFQLERYPDLMASNRSQMTITNSLLKFGKTINTGELNPDNEQYIYGLITEIEKNRNEKTQLVLDYFAQSLAKKYREQENYLMSELCDNSGNNFYQKETDYDEMLSFMRQPKHGNLQDYYLSRYRFTAANIIEYKAVQELENYNIDGAINWFKQDSLAGNTELPGNPFTIHITDCHDCDFNSPQKTKYTKYTFVLKLKELLNIAESSKNKNEKAQNYFLYANGLYNMTYYGNARVVKECMYFPAYDYSNYDYKDKYLTDNCDTALYYYQLAFSNALNKEFAAKCTWMSAKCELNNWYSSKEYADAKQIYIEGEYFHLMKDKYSNTKYYAEVIAECGYFCSFNGGGEACTRNKE